MMVLAAFFIPGAAAAEFCFEGAGREYEISPVLLETIAGIESNFNTRAINRNTNGSIDIGLMQINSFWIKNLGLNPDDLVSNPCYNTLIGAKILRRCIDSYGYTWEAVGCYNARSMNKKVAYAWKIFNRLKSEGGKQKPEAAKQQNNEIAEHRNASLFFRMRDNLAGRDQPEIGSQLNREVQ